MAYTDTKVEQLIYGAAPAGGGPFQPAGAVAWFGSLNQAFRLRRWAALITTNLTVTSLILRVDLQPVAGSAAGLVTGWGGTLTIPVAQGVQGAVFCTPELNLELQPGARMVLQIQQASTAGAGVVAVYGDYRWETMANWAAVTQLAA